MKKALLCIAVALCATMLSDRLYGQEQKTFPTMEMNVKLNKDIKDTDPHPIHLSEQQRKFVADNNAFTLRFLKTVNDEEGDGKSFVYSPLSITYVLSMVNDAAEGATEKELEKVLGFGDGGIKETQ